MMDGRVFASEIVKKFLFSIFNTLFTLTSSGTHRRRHRADIDIDTKNTPGRTLMQQCWSPVSTPPRVV